MEKEEKRMKMAREKGPWVVRGIVFANRRQLARVTGVAAGRRVSRSAVIREAIEQYLMRYERTHGVSAEDTTAA